MVPVSVESLRGRSRHTDAANSDNTCAVAMCPSTELVLGLAMLLPTGTAQVKIDCFAAEGDSSVIVSNDKGTVNGYALAMLPHATLHDYARTHTHTHTHTPCCMVHGYAPTHHTPIFAHTSLYWAPAFDFAAARRCACFAVCCCVTWRCVSEGQRLRLVLYHQEHVCVLC